MDRMVRAMEMSKHLVNNSALELNGQGRMPGQVWDKLKPQWADNVLLSLTVD